MTAKRGARERFPEVIAAAVRVFARDGYRSAHMSDVAREAGLSEAALYRYVDGKEGLFGLAIRHALLLEPLPGAGDPAGQLQLIMRELTRYLDSGAKARLRRTPDTAATVRLALETLTWFARHRHSDPYGAAIPAGLARETAIDALLHALVPARYLNNEECR